jgi:thiamine biosynthesis lipoprotein
MKPLSFFVLALLCLIMIAVGCKSKTKPLAGRFYSGTLFGKPYAIDAVGDSTDYSAQIDSIIHAFESNFDLMNPNSILSKFNAYSRRDSVFVFNDSTRAFGMVYDLTNDLNAATFQYFDPTLNPLKRAWIVTNSSGNVEPNLDSLYVFVGFDGAKMDLNEMSDSSHRYIESQLRKSDPRLEADFTTVAAALALDHIGDLLKDAGMIQFRIKYGRDIITFGQKVDTLNVFPIGVSEDSMDQYVRMIDQAFSFRNVKDKALMIDPSYGYPVDNEMAYVAVAAPSLVEATVFSEAFMAMGLEKASEFYEVNKSTRVQSFMFYAQDSVMHSASTVGFDVMLLHSDSLPFNQ